MSLDLDRAGVRSTEAAARESFPPSESLDDLEAAHLLLRRYRSLTDEAFGSGHLASLLYSLVRMHRPETVIELGSGLGSTALHLALALRENRCGHLWTVDDFELLHEHFDVAALATRIRDRGLLEQPPGDAGELIEAFALKLGVESRLTVVRERIDLDSDELVNDPPWTGRSVDLLFSDFNHGPEATMRLLAYWLQRMAPSSSIVIDSASTWWATWLALEKLHELLSAGKVPAMLQGWGANLEPLVQRRRFTLVPLTEVGRHRQNGAAWLKIEPVDLVPYPATTMRSATSSWEVATPKPIGRASRRREEGSG